MKYIVFDCELESGGHQKVPVIFPDFMIHSDVSKFFQLLLGRRHRYVHTKPVSAGFIELGGKLDVIAGGKLTVRDGVVAFGESETLKLKSDPSDASLIQLYNYTNGMT